MASNTVTRFNLLLLEEGELFFEDYAAILYLPNNVSNGSQQPPVSQRKQVRNLFRAVLSGGF